MRCRSNQTHVKRCEHPHAARQRGHDVVCCAKNAAEIKPVLISALCDTRVDARHVNAHSVSHVCD